MARAALHRRGRRAQALERDLPLAGVYPGRGDERPAHGYDLPLLRDGGRRLAVGTLDGSPNRRIFKPIAEWIAARGGGLRGGARATELLLERGGVAGVRLADGSVAKGDAYVLAAPVHSTRQLLPESLRSVQYFGNLWKLRSVPTINVQLWFDRYISAIDTCWFTGRRLLLGVRRPGAHQPAALRPPRRLDGRDVRGAGRALLASGRRRRNRRAVPARPGAALARRRGRAADQGHRRAHPQLALPRGARRGNRYRPDQRSPIANLFLAGDWTAQKYMASMEGAVQSAGTGDDAM